MISQCKFSSNKCTIWWRMSIMQEVMCLLGQGLYGKSLYLPVNFYVNLKLLFKVPIKTVVKWFKVKKKKVKENWGFNSEDFWLYPSHWEINQRLNKIKLVPGFQIGRWWSSQTTWTLRFFSLSQGHDVCQRHGSIGIGKIHCNVNDLLFVWIL